MLTFVLSILECTQHYMDILWCFMKSWWSGLNLNSFARLASHFTWKYSLIFIILMAVFFVDWKILFLPLPSCTHADTGLTLVGVCGISKEMYMKVEVFEKKYLTAYGCKQQHDSIKKVVLKISVNSLFPLSLYCHYSWIVTGTSFL